MPDLQLTLVDYDFEIFSIIAVMDDDNWEDMMERCPSNYQHKVNYFLNFNNKEDNKNLIVPDSYYLHDQGFEEVLNLIEMGCDGLFDTIERHKKSSD